MKIAVVSSDGESVSQHFGRSRYYKIFTIEEKKVTGSEMRERGTGHFAPGGQNHDAHEDGHIDPQGRHGFGADASNRHRSMAAEIGDCDVLIAGGMGAGAYESFKGAGLEVILTDNFEIESAVQAYINGTIKNLYMERTD